MNSRHAELLLDLLRWLEAHSEISPVAVNFNDSKGREFLYCNLTFEIEANKPKAKVKQP